MESLELNLIHKRINDVEAFNKQILDSLVYTQQETKKGLAVLNNKIIKLEKDLKESKSDNV